MSSLAHAEPGGHPGAAPAQQYLTFVLGAELFSINIRQIKEIIWYAGLTPVPMMPACIRGVINLRGAVVPVMDLSARFGRESTPVTKSTCIVIMEVTAPGGGERLAMGLVVDAVQAVLEIAADDIEPPPAFGARIRNDFVEGIAKINNKFVIVLHADQVLSMQEVAAMGQAAQPLEISHAA